MSVASAILEQQAVVLAAVHEDTLVLQPANVTVYGYAQELAEELSGTPGRPLRSPIETVPTHRVFVRRSQLTEVTLAEVASLTFGTATWRVHSYRDDPNVPEVRFECSLA